MDRLIVSVVMPAYNVSRYIGDALQSVMDQTLTDWETIVVNDGSTDTQALERAIGPFRHRIAYLEQGNMGAGAARNAAIREARGEWLAFLDADDRWAPTFLASQIEFLAKRQLDFAWCDGGIIGTTSRKGRRLMQDAPSRGPVTVSRLIAARVNVHTSATVVRRSLVVEVGGFDENLRRAQDFDLWVRLLLHGARAGYHRQPLVRYRVRDGNLTGDSMSQIERAVAVLQRLRDKDVLTEEQSQVLMRRLACLEAARSLLVGKRYLAVGDYENAVQAFRSCRERRPSLKLRLVMALMTVRPTLVRRLYLRRTAIEHR